MKRKLVISATLAAAMSFGLCACGSPARSGTAVKQAASTQAAVPARFETLDDIFSSDATDLISVYDTSRFTCAFNLNGLIYRVVAELPDGMYDRLNAVITENEADAQDMLAPLAVAQQEVFAEDEPTQEELDALDGKTGAELAAAGYVFDSLELNGNETICTATKDALSYSITFDGAANKDNVTDYGAAVRDMKATSVWFSGISWQLLLPA